MAVKKRVKKNPAAVALGRLGGKAKVPKGYGVLSEEERKNRAKAGAAARWKKKEGNES